MVSAEHPSVSGKVILQLHGNEFFHRTVSTFFHYKNIRLILEAGQDLQKEEVPVKDTDTINRFTHLRGASYYGGGRHES